MIINTTCIYVSHTIQVIQYKPYMVCIQCVYIVCIKYKTYIVCVYTVLYIDYHICMYYYCILEYNVRVF